MNQVQASFADELLKTAGVGGALKWFLKKPNRAMMGLGALMVGGQSLSAANRARQMALRGGEAGRYLRATPHGASESAYANYNRLFPQKATKKQIKRLHKNYKPEAFK